MGGIGSGPQRPAKRRSGAVKLHTPKEMPEGAKPYFRFMAQRASDHGLTQADVPMLAQLANALWLADRAVMLMAEDGILMTDQAHGDGTEKRKHPAFTIWRNAVSTADTIAKQFGMTPASRARLGLDESGEGPSLAEVLFGEVVGHRDD